MSVQAKWYNKTFECNSKTINLIDGLTTSFEINEETTTDKNGKSQTVKKGLKPQSVSFTINPVYAAGVNPRSEFESYKSLIGKTARLYVGSKAFGPYLMLKSASLSDSKLTNTGAMLSCKISLSFEQSTKKAADTDARKLTASKNSKKTKKTTNKKAATATKKTIKAGAQVKITGSKYTDGTKVKSTEKSKKYTIKNLNGAIATLSNGKKINSSFLSLC